MNIAEYIGILPYIGVSAVIVFALRLMPFVVFRDERRVTDLVRYIGKYLPPAVITGIVVYCFREIDLLTQPHGAKELLAAVVVTVLHLWKRNTLLSVFAGTLFYMIAVQRF